MTVTETVLNTLPYETHTYHRLVTLFRFGGTSVALQADVDKNVPELLKCRDCAAQLFVSAEPLVGPVDLTEINVDGLDSQTPREPRSFGVQAGVACHVKQLGANPVHGNQKHPKGGDPSEWPEDLQVQEFPVT